jgi:hypothetical protein
MTKKYSLLGKHLQDLYNTSEVDEQSLQEIERIVQEEGLTTSTSIAEFLMNTVKQMQERKPQNQSILVSDERARAIQNYLTDAPPPKVRELSVPFLYNGIMHEPSDIKKFSDQHLHYFVSQVGTSSQLTIFDYFHELIAYTKSHNTLSAAVAVSSLKTQDLPGSPSSTPIPPGGIGGCDTPCPESAAQPNSNVLFFEDIDYKGEVLELSYRHAISNLERCTLHQFLFFETEDWNDNISSVKCGDGTAIAYEHADFRGSTLTIYGSVPVAERIRNVFCCKPPFRDKTNVTIIDSWKRVHNQEISRLPDIGWNDRISSVLHGSYF